MEVGLEPCTTVLCCTCRAQVLFTLSCLSLVSTRQQQQQEEEEEEEQQQQEEEEEER